ncbi:MAG: hypothetical protein HY275_00840, partial [Gemmatimonadetes bacterium]|nr:hypothetical protein [Gemmatimonadota bacterium]
MPALAPLTDPATGALLADAATRATRFLAGLGERPARPDAAATAALAELD